MDLDVVLPSPVLPHSFKAGKSDLAGSKSQRDVETTKGSKNAPAFITSMNLTTEEWLVPQVFRTEMTDCPLQFILLDIPAPKTLELLPIDLDEERINALRLRSVATPESIRRDCH